MALALILDYFWQKEKLAFSLYLWGFTSYLPQQFLYFLPEPQVHPFLVYIVLCDIYSIISFSRKNRSRKNWYYVIYIVHVELYIF